jgi:regulatory protein
MKPLSLKMRAIALLSQREHSPSELRRKLLHIARQKARQLAAKQASACDGSLEADAADATEDPHGADAEAIEQSVETLLQNLLSQNYLSEERFIEARLHARARRFGSQRIQQELAQHGIKLGGEHLSELKSTEMARAKTVWQGKFGGTYPEDAAAKARQIRFLTARGFDLSLVLRLLRAEED